MDDSSSSDAAHGTTVDRRGFLAVSTATVLGHQPLRTLAKGEPPGMYGLIGRIVAVEGRRDELARILIDGVGGMPGCLSYVVAYDTQDEDALWVTEVWETQASHEESLSLPGVQEAIRKGRPLIVEFSDRFVTTPVGGQGPGLG